MLNLKKIGPGVSEKKSFKCVDGRTTEERTDDGRKVITIAYPEPSAQKYHQFVVC